MQIDPAVTDEFLEILATVAAVPVTPFGPDGANLNLIIPVGTQKVGEFEYTLQLNSAPSVIEDLGNLPIKVVNGATVYIRDVAQVHDGNAPQTSVVHVDGARSVVLSVLKIGSALPIGRPSPVPTTRSSEARRLLVLIGKFNGSWLLWFRT